MGLATSLAAPHTDPAASTMPSPPPTRYAAGRNAVPSMMPLTRRGVRSGFTWYISAATPATIAPDCDVPVPLK